MAMPKQAIRFITGNCPDTLVPKLQLGNPVDEALASQDRKLELPALNSQAGAWELATRGNAKKWSTRLAL